MLSASRHRHRKVSGSKYSRSLPPAGYASTSRRRRLSGSRYSRSLPRAGYALTSRRRRLSGSMYSRSLPRAGYALTSRRRRLSGSMYSHSLPRVYVVSKPQIRHCLLAVSPSSYDIQIRKQRGLPGAAAGAGAAMAKPTRESRKSAVLPCILV